MSEGTGQKRIKFREHRGMLEDSMQTVVEVVDLNALLDHLRSLFLPWPTAPKVSAETVHVEPYSYDKRIGWDTHIVTLDDYGVMGFTDGPVAMADAAIASQAAEGAQR